jgi:single-strand DNA-binding protein
VEASESLESLNLAVVRGTCSSPADVRSLPSGQTLAQVQCTTQVDGKGVSVPVAVLDPPAWVETLDAGDEILVVGSVHRRFFRAGGATASRVEIVATTIARRRDRRRAATARRKIDALLAVLDG